MRHSFYLKLIDHDVMTTTWDLHITHLVLLWNNLVGAKRTTYEVICVWGMQREAMAFYPNKNKARVSGSTSGRFESS